MQFQFSPYILPLSAGALIAGWVAVYSWSRRNVAGAIALAGLGLMIAEWLLGYALEIAGADLATKLLFGKMQYIGIAFVPFFWLLLTYNHANQAKMLSHLGMAALAVVPLTTIAIASTTEVHGMLWNKISIYQSETFSVLDVSHGVWFWVHSAYSYLLLLAGTIIILGSIYKDKGYYRGQAIALLVGVLLPWVSNGLYLSGLFPIPHLDITPFAFVLTAVALAWGIYGFRLVDLTPMGRDSVIEEMPDALVTLDMRGLVADANASALQLAGRSAAEAIGQPALEVFSRWRPFLEKYHGVMEATEEVNVGSDGNPQWYELVLSPLHDNRKRQIGRVIIVRDITHRKQTEERITQLSRAVDASPTSIVITDARGNIQYINPKFTQVTGYTPAEALGQNPRILKTEQTPPDVHRQLWETVLAGKEWRGEFCNRRKNGDLYWEMASISPIVDSSGNITHFVAVKEEITDRKEAERELAVAHEQALEASRLKSQLLSKVSHELRTPLGGILGYSELLYGDTFGPLNEAQKQAVSQVIESSRYLDLMVNELLDEAQIEAKTLTLHIQRFKPGSVLQRVSASMSVLCRGKGLELECSLDPDLPEEMWGDEYRLLEILLNLGGNAVKFTKAGKVKIHLYSSGPDHWAMEVTDTGVGIPAEAQSIIFEPFRQVYNAVTHDNRGTGLGLSITKHLVEIMGGSISVESEIGRGSKFTVLLPRQNPVEVKE
jgi:PAS domain S-box-containing protein